MNLATANYKSPMQGIALWLSILALSRYMWPEVDEVLAAIVALAIAVFLVWFGKGPFTKIRSYITSIRK